MKKTQKNAKLDLKTSKSNNTLLAEERKLAILTELQKMGKVTVTQLSQSMNVSEDTVRRDLRDLAQVNKLRKVHGGAMPLSLSIEPYTTRMHKMDRLSLLIQVRHVLQSLKALSLTYLQLLSPSILMLRLHLQGIKSSKLY